MQKVIGKIFLDDPALVTEADNEFGMAGVVANAEIGSEHRSLLATLNALLFNRIAAGAAVNSGKSVFGWIRATIPGRSRGFLPVTILSFLVLYELPREFGGENCNYRFMTAVVL